MFRKKQTPNEPIEWVVVGLGNPGAQYAGTRHNVGFDVIDLLAERHRIKVKDAKHRAITGKGKVAERVTLLAKPLTFMNVSGQAVAPLIRQNGVPVDRLIVISDDLDMAVGRVRIKPKGSAGGQGGHKSIIQSLGTQEYARIKIGIGRPSEDAVDHVLGKFFADERNAIKHAIEKAANAVECIVSEGLEIAMNRFNTGN